MADEEKVSWSSEICKLLVEGKINPDVLKEIQSKRKDEDRFEKILEIEQERVSWKEKILVPLQEYLYIVLKGEERVVKCYCGYEFGDYRQNWKLNALVYERDPQDQEIFRGQRAPDKEWMILREFYCPDCAAQLEVEAVPPGYPFIFTSLPNIDGFYAQRPDLRA